MKPVTLDPIPKLSDVPEGERTATVKRVLSICHQPQEQLLKQAEQVARPEEQIQPLKDEIAILQGEKARPKIKPSPLNQDPRAEEDKGGNKKRQRRGKPSRGKTQALEMHEEHLVQPDHIPPGSVFQG
jgi:hypothetical protein